jgi:hypothetical protein
LTINDQVMSGADAFKNQRIALETPQVVLGWNTVQLRYFTAFNKNRVGLHSYTDQQD